MSDFCGNLNAACKHTPFQKPPPTNPQPPKSPDPTNKHVHVSKLNSKLFSATLTVCLFSRWELGSNNHVPLFRHHLGHFTKKIKILLSSFDLFAFLSLNFSVIELLFLFRWWFSFSLDRRWDQAIRFLDHCSPIFSTVITILVLLLLFKGTSLCLLFCLLYSWMGKDRSSILSPHGQLPFFI